MAGPVTVLPRQVLRKNPCGVTKMDVSMQGKALFFKTISIKQKEIHGNFERVSSNLTLADGAASLLKDSSPQHAP
jgi:hypothetical protein